MSTSSFFQSEATYRVLADPSVLPLSRPASVFKKGELVRLHTSKYAVKEGYRVMTFHLLERDPVESGRIFVYDRDPMPEPDWTKYFEKVK